MYSVNMIIKRIRSGLKPSVTEPYMHSMKVCESVNDEQDYCIPYIITIYLLGYFLNLKLYLVITLFFTVV